MISFTFASFIVYLPFFHFAPRNPPPAPASCHACAIAIGNAAKSGGLIVPDN
jgi:hypothetical protein